MAANVQRNGQDLVKLVRSGGIWDEGAAAEKESERNSSFEASKGFFASMRIVFFSRPSEIIKKQITHALSLLMILLIVLLPFCSASAEGDKDIINLNKGLIARWIFEEDKEAVVLDRSQEHDFRIDGDIEHGTGERGPHVVFDGRGRLLCESRSALNFPNEFTITGWFKAENNKGLWGKWQSPDQRSYAVTLDGSMRIRFSVSSTGRYEDVASVRSRTRLQKAAWHFVAAVFSDRDLRLYIDGKLEAQSRKNIQQVYASKAPFEIGSTGIRGRFKGQIRDVRLYSRSLNDREIALLAADGFLLEVRHTLISPEKKAKILLLIETPLPDAKLNIRVEKDGRQYAEQQVKLISSRTELSLELSADHPSGFFQVEVSVVESEKGEILFHETAKVLIRKKSRPKDILYFSFYTPRYAKLTEEHLEALDQSPFTSMNAPLMGAYETHTLKKDDFDASVQRIKKCSKAVWPMVFVNRMVGSAEGSRFDHRNAYWKKRSIDDTPFSKIKLLDLYDRGGALTAFLDNFTLALRLARETQAPGVFVESEPYNCHQSRKIANLSLVYMKSGGQIVDRLKRIGSHMADLVNKTYPNAAIYFYSADLAITHEGCDYFERVLQEAGITDASRCFQSYAYIMLGMLERAHQMNYPLRVIDGELGEYTYPNLEYLKNKLLQEVTSLWEAKQQYPERLLFSTTIAPYRDLRSLESTNWIRRRLSKQAITEEMKILTIEDIEPLFAHLLKANDFLWIYGAGAADNPIGFDLFKPNIAHPYVKSLQNALNSLQPS